MKHQNTIREVTLRIALLAIAVSWIPLQSVSSAETYGGIGVEIGKWQDTRYPDITSIYHGSVAEKAGLLQYQQIITINGKATAGKTMEECKALLNGGVGSSVTLMLLDPRSQTTNTVTLVRQAIQVVVESSDHVLESADYGEANKVSFIEGRKSLTKHAAIRVSTNEVLWVATTNDGIAGVRFYEGGSSGSHTNLQTNWVTYSWNYRASPGGPLLSGFRGATNIIQWHEAAPERWVGKPLTTYDESMVKAGNEVTLTAAWGEESRKFVIAYDAAKYRVRVTELPPRKRTE